MKRTLILLCALICLFASNAQIVDPVKWTMEVHPTSATAGDVVWTVNIQNGYHIYGTEAVKDGPKPTKIVATASQGVTVGTPAPSRAATKINDPHFSLVLHEWSGTLTFTAPYTLDEGVQNATISSDIEYMACSSKACLPPAALTLTADIGTGADVPAADSVSEVSDVVKANTQAVQKVDVEHNALWEPVDMEAEDGDLTGAPGSLLTLLLMGFAGGLLALLTPCVWPMIPMTLSFFLKKTKSRARSVVDALTYGLSIVVIFLVLGIALTLIFGAGKLNEIATGAVFNIIFFVMLVVFAISFFGAFDITLPSKWSNAVDNKAERTTGILSIFFMAFTLVLVSFSCTGPIIGTLLVEAASDGSIVGPAVGMGGFALGLALPFSLFAFFPSLLKEMPKAGGWMNSVKVVLGFIELILSLKFLSVADLAYGWRILDREVFIAIWIVLFILLGMYLLGKLRFSHDSPAKNTSVTGFFLAVVSFSFAVYLVPGLWGAPLKAVSAFAPPLSTQDFNLYGGGFHEFDDYDEGMAYAAKNNRPVLVDFTGYACVNCRKMETAVFDTEAVRALIERDYVLIKLVVDDKQPLQQPFVVTENGKEVKIKTVGDKWSYLQRHKFGINSQPYYVLLDNAGMPLAPARVYDEDAPAFVKWLENGIAAYKNIEVEK